MATSIITGLINSGYNRDKICVADPNPEKLQRLKTQLQIQTYNSNNQAAEKANILVLAVKPQDLKKVADEIRGVLTQHPPLLISIAAAITTDKLKQWFGSLPIVRAMPNTPALLRAGATALYAGGKVSEEQKSLAESLMRGVGVTVWVAHEHDMDTVTALSGSGPAYLFLIMEALQQAAEGLGLPKETAKILTLQTALGASRMALESDIPIDKLIERVASPGGTTEKGLATLEEGGIRELLKKTLENAKARALEISQHFDHE